MSWGERKDVFDFGGLSRELMEEVVDARMEKKLPIVETYPILHMVVKTNRPGCIQPLIAKGAQVERQLNGMTPLQYAILAPDIGRRKMCVELLIEGGADVDAVIDDVAGNVWAGYPPIILALRQRRRPLALCVALIAAGCDVNCRLSKFGFPSDGPSALHIAAENYEAECVAALVEASADINALSATWTPLHIAVDVVSVEVVQKLLALGADHSRFNANHQTPLSVAADRRSSVSESEEHTKIVLALLDAEKAAGTSSVNSKDLEGFTPLHHAADSGNIGSINALIAAGAEVSRQTTSATRYYKCGGLTPLHCAVGGSEKVVCDEGRAACVAALLRAGASLDLRDHSFATPLQDAAINGMDECTRVLVAAEKRRFLSSLLADRLPLPKDVQLVILDFVLSLDGDLGEFTDSESEAEDSDEEESDDESEEEESEEDDANDDEEERTVESDATGDY